MTHGEPNGLMGQGRSEDPSLHLGVFPRQSKEAALQRLVEEAPKFHCSRDFDPSSEEGLTDWGIQPSFLKLMLELVTSSDLTIEIGSGVSTVCFAIIGSEHIVVSPSRQEHARIQDYCREHRLSTERIRFISMESSAAMLSLNMGGRKLDFALIDGLHMFPYPIVDFYYIDEYLKVGGHLAVDDLNIPSVGLLHKFLVTEPAYRLVKIDELKTGIYRKIGDTRHPDWRHQKFNWRVPDFSYLPFHERLRMRLGGVPGLRRAYGLLKAATKSLTRNRTPTLS